MWNDGYFIFKKAYKQVSLGKTNKEMPWGNYWIRSIRGAVSVVTHDVPLWSVVAGKSCQSGKNVKSGGIILAKRVLVTGAYGFIGRYTAKEFHKSGFYVIGLGHGTWGQDEASVWGVDEWHVGDVTMDALQTYALDCDVIVHCAGSGSVGFSISNPMKDFERTVWTTHYVLEFIRLYSPSTRFVYPSSAAVYGNQDKLPLSVSMSPNPISPYGVHKKIVEELCQMYANQYGSRIAILRLFSVYGNGLRKQLLWDACRKLSEKVNEFWGTGEETRDWVHVFDVARSMLIAVEYASPKCPVVNIGNGHGSKISDILKMVFKSFGENEQPYFGGQINVGNPNHYVADVREIKRWGWQPQITLEDGIDKYVRWFQEYDRR